MPERIYLLYFCGYCEECAEDHQASHDTDENIAGVFATKVAALAYLVAHPDYADGDESGYESWHWRIEEWVQDSENSEGKDAFISPGWRRISEGTEAAIAHAATHTPFLDTPPEGWPYCWWYDHLGKPLAKRPSYPGYLRAGII